MATTGGYFKLFRFVCKIEYRYSSEKSKQLLFWLWLVGYSQESLFCKGLRTYVYIVHRTITRCKCKHINRTSLLYCSPIIVLSLLFMCNFSNPISNSLHSNWRYGLLYLCVLSGKTRFTFLEKVI